MGGGMQCLVCGEPMVKPSKEQLLEILESKKFFIRVPET
jgi:hypothetical protein